MKKLILPTLLLLSTAAYAADPQIGTATRDDGYKLVWQDLFDADELDPMRWDIEVNGNGGGNHELQYYTDRPENVCLGDDGQGNHCLILTAIRETYGSHNFTSGRLNTKNRIAFTHGKVEASIKLPQTANGLWPAFWMMGNDFDEVGWPKSGEIDIMEMGNAAGISNGVQDRFFNGACHWGQGWPNASYAKSSTKNYSLQDGEFHLWTLIWDEQGVKMYVDLDKHPVQNPYYAMDCPATDDKTAPGYYFHKDNFIIFDLAVGGDFTGLHQPGEITALNDANNHRASMYVNYLKIYQKGLDSDHTDFLEPGDADASDGITEISNAATDTIHFDGTRVSSDCSDLTLYSLSGSKVASTTSGTLSTSALAPGIYLARDCTSTKKIQVR